MSSRFRRFGRRSCLVPATVHIEHWIQALEPRVMLSAGLPAFEPIEAPNLMVSIDRVKAPDVVVAGDKLSLSVIIANESNLTAQGHIDVDLLLSTDDVLDEGDLLIWSAEGRSINLATGRQLAVPVKLVARETRPGDYYILARVGGIFETTLEDNVASLGPRPFAMQFGEVAGRQNVKLVTQDGDGTVVTMQLKGPGTAELQVDDGGMRSLVVTGTTLASKLSIKTSGGTVPGALMRDILCDSDLGQLAAPTISLLGNAIFDGGLLKLDLGNLDQVPELEMAVAGVEPSLDDTPAHRIQIAGPEDVQTTVSLRLQNVADLSLISQQPIKSLSVAEWTDIDAVEELLHTPAIGSASIGGDLAVQLQTLALGKLTVAGDLLRDMDVQGDVGTLQARSFLGDVSISGNAKSVRSLQDHLALSKGPQMRGRFSIGGNAKLRTASEQVALHDTHLYFSGPQMYDLPGLLNFTDINRQWHYQTSIRNAVSFDGDVEQGVSTNRPQIGSFITYLVEEESEYTSGLYYWGIEDDSTYLVRRNIDDQISNMQLTFDRLLLSEPTMTLGQTLTDESEVALLIEVPSEDLISDLAGTAMATTTLVGHEVITVPAGTFLTAKLTIRITLDTTGVVVFGQDEAGLTIGGVDTITLWAHPDLGVVQMQENLTLSAKVTGGPSGQIGFSEFRRLIEQSPN